MKIAISADDLTSATDAAAPFVREGVRCDVALNHRNISSLRDGVVSVDKDSRAQSRAEAAKRAESTALKLAGADVFYQTVDSTIRGHLESEVGAALGASGRKVALLAPAFPAAGRTTEGGEQKLDGQPVTATAFARDPVHPVKVSRIRELFPDLRDDEVQNLSLEAVRALQPRTWRPQACKLVIADATVQSDLDNLVRAVAEPRDVLFCGSPGMARALASCFMGPPQNATTIPRSKTVLAVVGSLNERSHRQKHALLGAESVLEITLDTTMLADSPSAAIAAVLATAGGELNAFDTILLTVGSERTAEPASVAQALGAVAAEIVRSGRIDGMILTGGDTAAAVLNALGTSSISLLSELEPGCPLGLIDRPRPILVLTKAGGFGGQDFLFKAVSALRNGVTLQ
jgi:D-threonate/D-erythronate kinase